MNKISSEKLYPVFIPGNLRIICEVFEEDEMNHLYTKEIMGIPVCFYDLDKHGCLTVSELLNSHKKLYTFNEICNMEGIRYILQKFGNMLKNTAETTKYILYCREHGFDIQNIYIAQIYTSISIFYGAEIILCEKFLKEIANNLNSNLYLYLNCVNFIIILPDKAFLSKNGFINFITESQKLFDVFPPYEIGYLCNKVFYYDRYKNSYKEIINKYDIINYKI